MSDREKIMDLTNRYVNARLAYLASSQGGSNLEMAATARGSVVLRIELG